MEIDGNYTETLKQKAINDIVNVMAAMFKGNTKELWQYTQLSWRYKRIYFFKIEIKIRKKHKNLFIPRLASNQDIKIDPIISFINFSIEKIHFHSSTMIDAFVKFDQKQTYRIRMVAEKKPYKLDPEAPFRYNPNSLKIVA